MLHTVAFVYQDAVYVWQVEASVGKHHGDICKMLPDAVFHLLILKDGAYHQDTVHPALLQDADGFEHFPGMGTGVQDNAAVAFPAEIFFHGIGQVGVVRASDIRQQDADQPGILIDQTPGVLVGGVVVLFQQGFHFFPRGFPDSRLVVDHA